MLGLSSAGSASPDSIVWQRRIDQEGSICFYICFRESLITQLNFVDWQLVVFFVGFCVHFRFYDMTWKEWFSIYQDENSSLKDIHIDMYIYLLAFIEVKVRVTFAFLCGVSEATWLLLFLVF